MKIRKKKRKTRSPRKAPAAPTRDTIARKIAQKRIDTMTAIAESLLNPKMLKGLEQRAKALYELRTMPEVEHLGVQAKPYGTVADAIFLGYILGLPSVLEDSTQADEAAFLIQWAHYGYPVFRPSVDLMAGVMLSDPTHMQQRDLHVPFPAYVIQIPEEYRDALMTSGPGETRWPTLLAGFGVMPSPGVKIPLDLDVPPDVAERRILDVPYINATMTAAWSRAGGHLTMEEIKSLAGQGMEQLEKRGVYATLRKQRMLNPDDDMSNLFDHTIRPDARYWSEEDNTTLDAVARIGVGLSLYIQTKAEKLEPDVSKRARARQKGLATHYTLGRAVSLPSSMTAAAKEYARGKGKARKTRWVRRGHWRNQAYGPGRSLRRPTWIQPQWVGRGEIAPRVYNVDMKKD